VIPAVSSRLILASVPLIASCQFRVRSVEEYRKETHALVDSRRREIQNCYDDVLMDDPNASGTVIARFTVEAKTGVVKSIKIVSDSSAPRRLQECVALALFRLTLAPPDQREGQASFVWTFTPS
jgi:hypothetical protein